MKQPIVKPLADIQAAVNVFYLNRNTLFECSENKIKNKQW